MVSPISSISIVSSRTCNCPTRSSQVVLNSRCALTKVQRCDIGAKRCAIEKIHFEFCAGHNMLSELLSRVFQYRRKIGSIFLHWFHVVLCPLHPSAAQPFGIIELRFVFPGPDCKEPEQMDGS